MSTETNTVDMATEASMTGSAANVSEGFFDAVYDAEWTSPSRLTALLVFLLTQTLGNSLLAGIIWYERHGSDTYYRTLINQVKKGFFNSRFWSLNAEALKQKKQFSF
jgi:hypothetical protein